MTDSLRIIFMGTPEFAVPSLQELIRGPDKVVAAVCQPDRKRGRGRKLSPPPVKVVAEQASIPVLQPASIRSREFLSLVRSLEPDLIVVAAYGKILPGDLLYLPPHGTINVHGSLLPKYRGAAPIQWAIINGETETGVTIMQMDEGMDTGDILLTARTPIAEEDTAGTLFTRLAQLGARTLMETLALLRQGNLTPVPQDDDLATEAPLLSKEQGHIDWTSSARKIHCLIRGLDPWPTAYCFYQGRRYRFFRPTVLPGAVREAPGTVSRIERGRLVIATGADYLQVAEIQPEGKKRMSVQALLCGMDIPVGSQFT